MVSEVNGEPVDVICEKSYKLEALQQRSQQPADVPGSVKTSKRWIIIIQTQLNKGVNIFQIRAWHSGTQITTSGSYFLFTFFYQYTTTLPHFFLCVCFCPFSFFGRAFEKAAESTSSRTLHDHFDTSSKKQSCVLFFSVSEFALACLQCGH